MGSAARQSGLDSIRRGPSLRGHSHAPSTTELSVRDYELALLITPDLTEEQLPEAFDRVRQMVTSRGGEIVKEDPWGRRRLAYPIGKHIEGNYMISDIKLAPERIRDLEASLQISEDVLRHMLIRRGD